MQKVRLLPLLAVFGVGTALVALPASAATLSRATMPSTVAQCFGYGYSAGHHAPIVRTPGMHPERAPRNVRVPRYAEPLYPAPYEPLRCYGEACYGVEPQGPAYPVAEPHTPVGDLVPTPAAAPRPATPPDGDRQVWRRPF
jgi:hypothetical protein